ncbi:MAG: diguanylate cyclase [Anaerolineales bacterium]
MNTPLLTMDELTGALSRESFEERFSAALLKAVQNNLALSLAVLDIDQFLLINENYGRQVGDAVLVETYKTLQKLAPENSLIFRYGGDEFYLLLPDTTREQALLLMERIRLVAAEKRSYLDDQFSVSLTVGIASYPIDGTAEDELQRKADQALYRAKKAGRSQVMLAYDEKMVPKTVHFTETQLERLSTLAEELAVTEARLLREALDDLINKYNVTTREA